MTIVSIERKLNVPLNKAWPLLGDYSRSPSHAFRVILHEEGDPKDNGVGTVRSIKIGLFTIKQRLEDVEPSKYFTYSILSGPPVRKYTGKYMFIQDIDSTIIRWNADIEPKYPLIGWIIAIFAKKAVNQILDQIESDYRKN